jgi:hypothetical protein
MALMVNLPILKELEQILLKLFQKLEEEILFNSLSKAKLSL